VYGVRIKRHRHGDPFARLYGGVPRLRVLARHHANKRVIRFVHFVALVESVRTDTGEVAGANNGVESMGLH
jgi:hypothetical protein